MQRANFGSLSKAKMRIVEKRQTFFMPTEPGSDLKFEIGHVLFIDIVGYSKLLMHEQSEQLQKLKEIVRATEQFRLAEAEGKLLRLPTGDGGALVFRNTQEAPVLCAVEISKGLKSHPELRVRMGIHSGPVNEVADLNEQMNVAGAGINIARRVMDCGDAGHTLLSKHVAEDLEDYARWRHYLHELGECETKHGEVISVVNLYDDEVGNPQLPQKLKEAQRERAAKAAASRTAPTFRRKPLLIAVGFLLIAAIGIGFWINSRQKPAIPSGKSIAVLPFENLSSDKENAYFAEGIQDEILTRLAKIADLKVISRRSTQEYATAPRSLRDVGKQLGVANVLEGSVQKVANAVHVNVQLIRAATDEHLWAESYNRKLDDVFAVEGEVASAVAEQLNAKLSGAEQKAISEKPTQNTAAYEAYLRGVTIDNTGAADDIPKAAAAYVEAVRLDPSFADAWARLAVARSFLYFNGIDPQVNTAEAVREAADRASALQPDSGEALLAQAVYRYRVLRDFHGALEKYQQAQKRLPNSSFVLEQMAHVERRLGEPEAAESHYRAADQLDPRNVDTLLTLGELLGDAQRFKEAEQVLDRALEVSPGNEEALAQKAFNFQHQGRLSDSAAVLNSVSQTSQVTAIAVARRQQLILERRFEEAIAQAKTGQPPLWANDPRTITMTGYGQEWAGHKDEARDTFTRAVAAILPSPNSTAPVDNRQLGMWLALAYAGLNEKEKALQEARRTLDIYKGDALARGDTEVVLAQIQARFGDADSAIAALPHLLEIPAGVTRAQLRLSPFWDPLRNDPRFQKLCEERRQ
jgi:TolB-like protein/class 3 adenylate cyclase/cytochrome c-type biogenesis protein CcmH/NrfG